ncbi:MAG: hypothetical protein JSW27_16900 [Phycisphaerales bacterium]|nr:MAG: hypothetical protein JSW27_16900 [Phycisphaerales bacterium]
MSEPAGGHEKEGTWRFPLRSEQRTTGFLLLPAGLLPGYGIGPVGDRLALRHVCEHRGAGDADALNVDDRSGLTGRRPRVRAGVQDDVLGQADIRRLTLHNAAEETGAQQAYKHY